MNLLIAVSMVLLLLVGCADSNIQIAPKSLPESMETLTPLPTVAPYPTSTPKPEISPTPTRTPDPTRIPAELLTPAPLLEPLGYGPETETYFELFENPKGIYGLEINIGFTDAYPELHFVTADVILEITGSIEFDVTAINPQAKELHPKSARFFFNPEEPRRDMSLKAHVLRTGKGPILREHINAEL